jgi:hypothetical protein
MKAVPDKKSKLAVWFKKFGLLGLIFFTVKGLIWLAVILFAANTCNG